MKKKAVCFLIALALLSCQASCRAEAGQLQTESAVQFYAWIESEEQYRVLSVGSSDTTEEVRVQATDAETGHTFTVIVSFRKDLKYVDFIIPDLCTAPDSPEGYKLANDANLAAVFAVYLLNGTGTLWAISRQTGLPQELLQQGFGLFVEDAVHVYRVISGL